MKKIVLAAFTVLFSFCFVSCENLEYLSNDRVVFEGYVQRRDGTPIADINVSTYVYLDKGYGDSDNISYTKTDADGHYIMIFPRPTNADHLSLFVNTFSRQYNSIDDNYTQYALTDILPNNINPLYLDFGNTVLYTEDEITSLTINFITDNPPLTGNFPLTDYEGLFPYAQSFYNMPINDDSYYNYAGYPGYWEFPDEPFPGSYQNGLFKYNFTLLEDGITYSITFDVITNQQLTFRYLDAGNNVVSVNIPILNQPVTYTVNY